MTRIFVELPFDEIPTEFIFPDAIELDIDVSKHLRDVLRLVEGNQVEVVCKKTKREFLAIITSTSKVVSIKLLRPIDRILAKPVIATLVCGLPKGSHADQICEQISQLGIETIVFWIADRSVSQPKQSNNKLERWQKIAEASARQSQGNTIPKVIFLESSNKLQQWLAANTNRKEDLLAICSLSNSAKAIKEIAAPPGRAHLVVGPEGDFTAEEISSLEELGAKHVSLGPLVLRVETAAVVGCSMGLAVWGWR